MTRYIRPLVACVCFAQAFVSTFGQSTSYFLNFGDTAYTTDGTHTWQSIDLTVADGAQNQTNPQHATNVLLSDTSNDSSAGITFSTSGGDATGNSYVLHDDALQTQFTANPYAWFDPASAPQRETVAVKNATASWTYTFSGFAATDVVDIEFVFGRAKTGDRAMTVTYQAQGDVMDNEQVGEDGGPQYPAVNGMTGSTSYSVTIAPSGTGWGCLPNAIHLRVSPPGAPAAAGSLTVTSATRTEIDLAWSDNSLNETGFKVQRAPDIGGPWTTLLQTAADVTTFSDTTVTSYETYVYRIVATNAIGDSSPSNAVTADAHYPVINAVFERPVTLSSTRGGSHIAVETKLVDGSIDTSDYWGEIWQSGTVGNNPVWAEVDLGNSYEVSEFRIWSSYDASGGTFNEAVVDFDLQYWDGNAWVTFESVTGNTDGEYVGTFPDQVIGEKFRWYIHDTEGARARVYEIELYGREYELNVENRFPAKGEVLTRNDQSMEITFNRDIAFVNSTLINYRDPGTGQPVGGFSASIAGPTLTITPDVPMPYAQEIEVVIPDGTVSVAGDAGITNKALALEFSVAPEVPQFVSLPVETEDLLADLVLTFDRDLVLLDAGKVALRDLETFTDVPGISVTVTGNQLTVSHSGLTQNHRYGVVLEAGAVEGLINGADSESLLAGMFAGKVFLYESSFLTGTEGMVLARSLPEYTATVRWFHRRAQGTGPGLDGTYLEASSRQIPEDFAATPYLNLEVGQDYVVVFDMQSEEYGPMKVSLATGYNRSLAVGDVQSTTAEWGFQPDQTFVFTPTAADQQYFILWPHEEGQSTKFARMDNLSVTRAVHPVGSVSSPLDGSTYLEGDVIDVSVEAQGIIAEVASVEIYDPLRDEVVVTLTEAPYQFDWEHYVPGPRDLEIRVTDESGLQTVITRSITINFADGTLPAFTHYDFNKDTEGWTGFYNHVGDGPDHGGPNSLALDVNGNSSAYIQGPKLFLFAGQVYEVSFDYLADSGSNAIWGFKALDRAVTSTPLGSETPTHLLAMTSSSEWATQSFTFTVLEDGAYYLTFWPEQNADGVMVDDVRLVGQINQAPEITLTGPENGLDTVVGATATLSADAADSDGTLSEVRFMRGSRILGVDTEAPYTMEWVIPSVGNITLHAVAVDSNGGETASNSVTITAEENVLDTSTFVGNSQDDEGIRHLEYQSDGTLVLCGNFDTSVFGAVTPTYLNGAVAGDRGVVVRVSENGQTVLSVTVVAPQMALDMSLDDSDHLYVALGPAGAVKLTPDASSVVWSHSWAKNAHRIDSGPTGITGVLLSNSNQYDEKQLTQGEIALIDAAGIQTTLMPGAGVYTTDVCVDEANSLLHMIGYKNITTDNNPVDIPITKGRDFTGVEVYNGYDWGAAPGASGSLSSFINGGTAFSTAYPSWDPLYDTAGPAIGQAIPPTVADLQALAPDANSYTNGGGQGYLDAYTEWREDYDRWLNQPENNMADTRGARCVMGDDGYLYYGFEFDGGNSPLRYSPLSLSDRTTIVGGDNHSEMSNTSTVPKVFVGRYDPATGDYILGNWITARLSNGSDNTIRLERGDIHADEAGRVHVVGKTFSHIRSTVDFLPGLAEAGAFYLAWSPDFTTREIWIRPTTGGEFRGVAVSPNRKIALGGMADKDNLFLHQEWQATRASDTDGLLVVGDFSKYYKFQVGIHPRLLFGPEDVQDLRDRLTVEPYQSIYNALLLARNTGRFGGAWSEDYIYDKGLRAQIDGFLYVLTGDEAYAQSAREMVEDIFENSEFPWAQESTKGLGTYWLATRVAFAYDWCVNSDAWDSAFDFKVSSELSKVAKVIIDNGGSEQNLFPGSNWLGGRWGSGGLALLAMDHVDTGGRLNQAYNKMQEYINAAYSGSGWLSEGEGYFYFPVGNYAGPFGLAMARHDPSRDLRSMENFGKGFYAAIASVVATEPSSRGWGGIKTDWSDDNPSIGSEGAYALGFAYIPESLRGSYKWAYDHLQGADTSLFSPTWDRYRAGAIMSYLYYPADVAATQPADSYDWNRLSDDSGGIGIYTFRNQILDQEDLLAQFKTRHTRVNGHDAPDGLGFRIIAAGAPFAIGGGRNGPGKVINQASVYPVDPSSGSTPAWNENLGSTVGTPLITEKGDGHVIGFMATSNLNVSDHKRWFVSSYNKAETGVDAAFLIADTSDNGAYWHLPTYVDNTVSIAGNTFTITGENGSTMKGTVLYPTSGVTITTGVKDRGDVYAYDNNGSRKDWELDPVTYAEQRENRYVQFNGPDGDFLVVLTIQKAGSGGAHTVPVHNNATVANADVNIGTLQLVLQNDDVHYGVGGGSVGAYSFPSVDITFDAGANGTITSGNAVQAGLAYGSAATEPTVQANTGWVFAGWDQEFDQVLRTTTIHAQYNQIEVTPTEPSLLVATTVSPIQIELSWKDRSFGESGFEIEVSSDGSTWNALATVPAETESYSHTGLTASTTYYYQIRALADPVVGVSDSAWVGPVSGTTETPNNLPTFDNPGNTEAHEDVQYFHSVFTSDPDNDDRTLTATVLPSWLTFTDFGDGSGDLEGTPGEADTGSHPVTIEVFDGIDTALQNFTIVVNAAPDITVVSPSGAMARVASDHGVELEIEVTDESATTTSWSKLFGPGSAVFDDETANTTGVTVNLPGDYVFRATVSDGTASDFTDITVTFGADSATGLVPVTIVDYRASEAASGEFRNTDASRTENVDVDGDGDTDDSVTHYNFQSSVPLSPQSGTYSSPDSRIFYGGIYAGIRNGTRSFSSEQNTGSAVNVRLEAGNISLYSGNPGPGSATWNMFFYWDKADFLNGADTQSAALAGAGSLSFPENLIGTGGTRRWLVRNGSQFYLSQTVIGNNVIENTLTGDRLDQEMWAVFDPTENSYDFNFDQGQAVFNVPTSTFTDVTAVGFYVERDSPFSNRNVLQFGRFSASLLIDSPIARGPVLTVAQQREVAPNTALPMIASVEDEGLPNPPASVSVAWSKRSGPAGDSLTDAQTLNASFEASVEDAYVLRVLADDGGTRTFKDVDIAVETGAMSAPTGLAASLDGGNHISLDWTDNSEGDLAGYTLYRSTVSGVYGIALAEGLTTSEYLDTTVESGITYYYVVTASDTNGNESAQSTEASELPVDTIAPQTPSGLVAIAGDNEVTLDWADNPEPDLDTYTVYRSTTSGVYGAALASGVGISEYTDSTAVNGTTYYYVVTATDFSANESGQSSEDSALPSPSGGSGSDAVYLLNFSELAYTSDGTNTWQTFDLNTGTGDGSASGPVSITNAALVDTQGSSSAGVTLSVTTSGVGAADVAYMSIADLTNVDFSGNPYAWYDSSVTAQRETFSMRNASGTWTYTFSGFDPADTVSLEFVLARGKTGDRATTISYQTAGDVLNDAQVDEDGGPQYPTLSGLTGLSSYTVTIDPSGTGWGCLPNAIRIHTSAPTPPPGGGTRNYRLNFSELAYTSDGTDTWQTFDLNTGSGDATASGPAGISNVTLADTQGSTSAGLTFSVSTSGVGGADVAYLSTSKLTNVDFSGNPYAWYDASVAAQRETFSIKDGSGTWTYTFSGFDPTDTVNLEFVLARGKTGDRATTISYQTTGDVLNDAQVDEDGGPQYPSLTGLTGSSSYTVTIDPSGDGWGCLPNALNIEVIPAVVPDQQYFLNFSELAYTSDGTHTWQTFDLNTGTGDAAASGPSSISSVLVDSQGNSSAGVTLSVTTSGVGGTDVAYLSTSKLTNVDFTGNPYPWYDASVAAQRETYSIKNGSGTWTYTFSGFDPADTVDLEFVLARGKTGDRATTISYQTTGDVLNDAQVDEDGGPQYPTLTGLTGASSYTVTIDPSGSGWGCLPNAIRINVAPGSTPPAASPLPMAAPAAAGSGAQNDQGSVGTSNNDDSELRASVAVPVSKSYAFEFTSETGSYYRVYYRHSLLTGEWQVLRGYENMTGTGSVLMVEDNPPGTCFYKIEARETPWP